jgi:hypothetical protein
MRADPSRGSFPATATRDVHYGYDLVGKQIYARYDGSEAWREGITNEFNGFGRQTSSTNNMDSQSRTLSYAYIEVRADEVALGAYHMKIVVIPDDQKSARGADGYQQNADGDWFRTVGAGPNARGNLEMDSIVRRP